MTMLPGNVLVSGGKSNFSGQDVQGLRYTVSVHLKASTICMITGRYTED